MKTIIGLLVAGCWSCIPVLVSSAQELSTNAQLFENLGLECLGDIPHEADSLTLVPPPNLPYLTSALIQHWQQQGTELFSTDSLRTSKPYYSLSWEISRATITYARAGRRTLSRSAKLDLRYSFLGKDGEFLVHDSCQRAISDRIPKGIVEQLESPAFPETQAELPPDSWIRRYLEPVILAAATGLAAFLFFNLRSKRVDP
ncbi:MAG: hypothetical protein F4146_05905 [Rhodothermaceae bacterium]|nr:hypothetical protein [Rhodothermaceae bacterium]MYH08062.1 hypothetical protein [Rhodothermaceae bacterium]